MPSLISESISKLVEPAPQQIFLPPLPGMDPEPIPTPEVQFNNTQSELIPTPEVPLTSFNPEAYMNAAPTASLPTVEESMEDSSTEEDSNVDNSSGAVTEAFGGLPTDSFTPPTQDVPEPIEENNSLSLPPEENPTVIMQDFGVPSDLFNVPVEQNNLQDSLQDNTSTNTPTVETNMDGFFASTTNTPTQGYENHDTGGVDPTAELFPQTPGQEASFVAEEASTTIENNSFTPTFANTFSPPAEPEAPAAPAPELLDFDPSKYLSGGKSAAAPSLGISANDLPAAQGVSAPAPAPATEATEDYSTMQEDSTTIFTKDINNMEEVATPETAPSFDHEEEDNTSNQNDTMQILRELSTLKELF